MTEEQIHVNKVKIKQKYVRRGKNKKEKNFITSLMLTGKNTNGKASKQNNTSRITKVSAE